MDQNLIHTFKSAGHSSESRTEENRAVDSAEFSNILEDTKSTSSKDKSKFIEGQVKAASAEVTSSVVNDLSSLLNYIYALSKKNPDSLSLAEKQLLRIDKDGNNNVDTKQIQKALNEKGVKLNDLSSDQITKLMQTKDSKELYACIDSIIKDNLKFGGTKEKDDSSIKQIDGLKGAEKSKETGEAGKTKREEVMQQILDHIEVRNLKMGDEVVVRLNPEYLGELKFRVFTSKDKKAEVEFITESKEVKAIINENSHELVTALEKKNLTVSNIKVNLIDKF